MIVKVQRPQASNDPAMMQQLLVYSKDSSISTFLPCTKEIDRMLGNRQKDFFHADVVGTILHFQQRADWQDW